MITAHISLLANVHICYIRRC